MEDLMEFFHLVGELKDKKRTGWLVRKVKEPESIADHSFRLAFLALVLASRFNCNAEKCIKMALVHDLPEAVTGDIPSRLKEEDQKMRNKEKHELELKAMQKILSNVDEKLRKELMSLWLEFEKNESKEAKLIRQLDRLELAFQTFEYEKQKRHGLDLDEFYAFARSQIYDPELIKIFEKIKEKRK